MRAIVLDGYGDAFYASAVNARPCLRGLDLNSSRAGLHIGQRNLSILLCLRDLPRHVNFSHKKISCTY
jgi:hypothetical protein